METVGGTAPSPRVLQSLSVGQWSTPEAGPQAAPRPPLEMTEPQAGWQRKDHTGLGTCRLWLWPASPWMDKCSGERLQGSGRHPSWGWWGQLPLHPHLGAAENVTQHRRPPRPAAGRALNPGVLARQPQGPVKEPGEKAKGRQWGHHQPHLCTAVGMKMSRGPGLRATPHDRAAQGHAEEIPALRSSDAKLEITRPPGAYPFGRHEGRQQRHTGRAGL